MPYALFSKTVYSSRFFLASCALLASTAMPWQTYAQTPTQNEPSASQQSASDEDEDTKELIVVTGSRIKRTSNEESAIPLTSINAEDLLRGSGTTLGDTLNNLPALRSSFSLGNSNQAIGTAGVNFLDLRGLGSVRTLVLINGRRQVGSLQGSSQVDVNTISTALLERVDVITGGASAVYGSDAVSGVVNFITKKDFDGAAFTGFGSRSSRSDANRAGGSVTLGKNFNEGRGNIAGSIEYNYTDSLGRVDKRLQP